MDKDNNLSDWNQFFDFLKKVGNLKNTQRFSEIKMHGDSSADHSWRLALMASLIIDEKNLKLDKTRAIEIALVHDLAESITGDIDAIRVKRGEVTKEEKQKGESKAIEELKNTLRDFGGDKIKKLWLEYEEVLTGEARFIKALDKLETLTHLIELGHEAYDEPEFMASYADEAVKNFPELKDMLLAIKNKLRV